MTPNHPRYALIVQVNQVGFTVARFSPLASRRFAAVKTEMDICIPVVATETRIPVERIARVQRVEIIHTEPVDCRSGENVFALVNDASRFEPAAVAGIAALIECAQCRRNRET